MRIWWKEYRWFVILAVAVVGTAHIMSYEQHRAAAKYQAHRASYCASIGGTAKEQEACKEEKREADDYLKWWEILYTWPEGATVWAIIATGFIIAWQSYETRKSSKAARDAIILQHRPKIVVRDVQLTKDKFGNFVVMVTIRNGGSNLACISETKFQINWISLDNKSVESHIEKIGAFNLEPAEPRTFKFTAPEFYIRFEASRILLEEHPEQTQTVAIGCFSVISYTDAIGTKRETSLNRTYSFRTKEFTIWDKEKDYSD